MSPTSPWNLIMWQEKIVFCDTFGPKKGCEYERQKQAKISKNKQKHVVNKWMRNLIMSQLFKNKDNDARLGKLNDFTPNDW